MFQSLLSITAILFGLFAVFLSGYESARAQWGKRRFPYLILSLFMGATIIIGGISTLLAYWVASDGPLPFGFARDSTYQITGVMLQILVVLEIVSIIAFGIAYLIVRK